MKFGTKAEREEAEKVLGEMGLRSYVNKIDAVFQAVDLAIGYKELLEDPDARQAIGSVKSTADFVEKVGPWLGKSAHMASFVKAAGGVSHAADAVLSLMDVRDDLETGDFGGATGDALKYLGAALLAADAIPGVDGFTIPATIILAAGTVVKRTLGDTDQEKELQELAEKVRVRGDGRSAHGRVARDRGRAVQL